MSDSWERSRILIVGGAGFVGSNLTRRLLDHQLERIVIIDNLLSSEKENIPEGGRINFWEGSIADDSMLGRVKDEYDWVFHLATYHGNQSSIHDPLADHEHNLLTTLKLLNHMKGFQRVRKVVYAGAGCAVAKKTSHHAEATSEDAPLSMDMDSPYSISKLVGEFYAVYFHKHHGLPTVRARFQNVYGPGEVLGAGKWRGTPATVWRNVIPTFVYKAIKGEALPLENQGIATRDFIYVDDIVEGLMRCADVGSAGDVYNLASGLQTHIRDLADILNRLTNNPSPPRFLPPREWDRSGCRFGSTSKARAQLGFEAHIPLEEGLRRTIAWTKGKLPFIEKTIQKHNLYMTYV